MFRLIKNLARGTKTSLRSKRFRLVSEQKETVEGDFRFWSREKLNEPFFARSLTLFSRSLLLNRTETLTTQAIQNVIVAKMSKNMMVYNMLHNFTDRTRKGDRSVVVDGRDRSSSQLSAKKGRLNTY